MSSFLNIGLIECKPPSFPYSADVESYVSGFQVKKVFMKTNFSLAKSIYPRAEAVTNIKGILQDDAIDLIIVRGSTPEDIFLISKVVGSGKKVRIV